VAVDPSNPTALAALARTLGAQRREEEALSSLQRAIELTPERAPRDFVAMLKALKQRLEAQQIEARSTAAASEVLAQDHKSGAPTALLPLYPHDARAQIDRVPVRTSCPTAGPALLPSLGEQLAEVRYVVGENGKVSKVERIAGSEEAVEAIRSWLSTCAFEPGRRGGNPVPAEVKEVFRFVSK